MLEVKYRHNSQELYVFKEYLGDNLDIVSFSNVIKKLPLILKDLSNLTYTRWKAVLTLTEDSARIEVIHNRLNDALVVYIFSFTHDKSDFPKLSKLVENIMKQLKKKFSITGDEEISFIRLVDGTKFIFSLYENNRDYRLIEFDITSVKPSLKERISTWLFHKRHPEKDYSEVLIKRDLSGEMVL